jgi:hypothetical protein
MTATQAPADQRSAMRVVFPGPRWVELEEVIVDSASLGRTRSSCRLAAA